MKVNKEENWWEFIKGCVFSGFEGLIIVFGILGLAIIFSVANFLFGIEVVIISGLSLIIFFQLWDVDTQMKKRKIKDSLEFSKPPIETTLKPVFKTKAIGRGRFVPVARARTISQATKIGKDIINKSNKMRRELRKHHGVKDED